MPQVFDNIDKHLLTALSDAMGLSERADFCVGYFNLRGWRQVDGLVERWQGGDGHCCRLLVGMQQMPQDQLRTAMSLLQDEEQIDQSTAIALKRKLAQDFRDQLMIGIPTNEDEAGLHRLAEQITANKMVVKLFLRHPLHAKLYLLFRQDPINPKIGYLGSSNLTLAGLSKQGELNIDVLDHDACDKLARWFENRWNDRFCIDISKELVEIINSSWARPEPILPYHIYVKMAYHLSQEARSGLTEFRIPSDFGDTLFEFQKAAVKIAAHHLNKRGGGVIGDVVGLGKTLMATALARIFEDDHGLETLIICPKNLISMWEDYRQQYRLRAKVLSISNVQRELPDLRRYRLVLIDESHNLRNREGKRYRSIAEYISSNDSLVILLSATPYNKTYLDLSNQLRLFVDEQEDIGIRPERLLRELGETEFIRRHQCPVRSLSAFEKSEHTDDWHDLMRLYLIRRTRSFIQLNYAKLDPACNRRYLEFSDGTKSYFPTRFPKTVKFTIDPEDKGDQYVRLFADDVVNAVNHLALPRYGLGNYLKPMPHKPPTPEEAKILADLSRAGARLKGFCRTNLFKRLESSGHVFILSLDRHILRNYIFLHAIENDLPLPIGTQDVGLLDPFANDEDSELWDPASGEDDDGFADPTRQVGQSLTEGDIAQRAAEVYEKYKSQFRRRFKWLQPGLFDDTLSNDLRDDANALMNILKSVGSWNPARDKKLQALLDLLTKQHPKNKVLLFTQFADTVDYLESQIKGPGLSALCYSFLPADGVERIIRLRHRVRQRLRENAEVVGTDEAFFEDEKDDLPLLDLYNEKSGILDADDDTEVDLASYAYQIWKNAIDKDPKLEKIIAAMPNVVYSTRPHQPTKTKNDLITFNLDIWQFARDVILNAEGPELLRAFWQAIEKVTVLDPTCGSGAFLFAALSILETLYSDCLERMERFVEDLAGKPHHPEQFSDFKKVLAQIAKHPNDRYFVLKSIIINNLFGVDIMEEAVEICKLRLFLKLVAQVETAEQIEPLPDIDFNIRAGNTLIGYATEEQARKALTRKTGRQLGIRFGETEAPYRQFEEKVEIVDKTFRAFRDQQTIYGGKVTHEDKLELRNRLKMLEEELDRYLAREYDIMAENCKTSSAYEQAFNKWKTSHQPFHWFIEFYGIMHGGGFDVIIGNPPYVEYRMVRDTYQLPHGQYASEPVANLYAFCMERSMGDLLNGE